MEILDMVIYEECDKLQIFIFTRTSEQLVVQFVPVQPSL